MTMIYTYDGSTSSCNLTTVTTSNVVDVMYYFKRTLVQAGWTVIKSGDGFSSSPGYSATGDVFSSTPATGYGSVSTGLNNASAWYVLRAPGSVAGATRQLCVQRNSAGAYAFSIDYSYSAGFVTGGAYNTKPTASDSQAILPASDFINGGVTYRFSIGADNAAPYGFYMFMFPVNGGNPICGLVMDPLTSGTYDSADVDPYIFYMPSAGTGAVPPSAFLTAGLTSETLLTGPTCYYKKGLAGETFITTPALKYQDAGAVTVPSAMLTNPYSSKDETYPMMYARRSALAQPGFKGVGSMMKWIGQSGRSTGDTLSVASTGAKDYIVVGNIALPWNGSTPTV